MADSKLADLTAESSLGGDELVYVVDDPSGTPVDRKVTVTNLLSGAGGGFDTLLATVEVTGSPASSIDFTSISQDYDDLILRGEGILAGTSGSTGQMAVRLGDGTVDSDDNYEWYQFTLKSTDTAQTLDHAFGNEPYMWVASHIPGANSNASGRGAQFELVLPNYADTSVARSLTSRSLGGQSTLSESGANWAIGHWLNTSDPVTTISLFERTGNLDLAVGSKVRLIGRSYS